MSQCHRRVRAFCAGALIAAAGCAGSQARSATPTALAERTVRLSVKNEFGSPVNVFVVGAGSPWRLGRVMALSARDFIVPNALIQNGPVEFVIAGDGSAPARSGPMLLTAGRVVDFRVTRPLFTSTAIVRR